MYFQLLHIIIIIQSTCNAKVGLIKLIIINSKHIVTYFCYTTILKFWFQLIINSMEGLMASLKLLTFVFGMSTCKTFQIWLSLIRFWLIFLVTGCKNPLFHLGEKKKLNKVCPLKLFKFEFENLGHFKIFQLPKWECIWES
jgi:hypothetical protein